MNETKDHILKTAFGLFLQKTYKEVTLKEIVEKTGLSKGAFYHYFESKEKLFFEVINTIYFDNIMIDYNRLNRNSLYEFYHDYIDKLSVVLDKLRNNFNYNDSSVNINFIATIFDAIHLFPDIRNELMKTMLDELNSWTNIVNESRAKGEFSSPMTDEQIARMFVYSSDGIGLRLFLEGKIENMHTEMLTLWDNFYKEIKD